MKTTKEQRDRIRKANRLRCLPPGEKVIAEILDDADALEQAESELAAYKAFAEAVRHWEHVLDPPILDGCMCDVCVAYRALRAEMERLCKGGRQQ